MQQIEGRVYTKETLREEDWSDGAFFNCRFEGCSFRGANLSGIYTKSCRFIGCDHIHEPDCAVKAAVEEGKINKVRYDDYTEMYRELKERKRY